MSAAGDDRISTPATASRRRLTSVAPDGWNPIGGVYAVRPGPERAANGHASQAKAKQEAQAITTSISRHVSPGTRPTSDTSVLSAGHHLATLLAPFSPLDTPSRPSYSPTDPAACRRCTTRTRHGFQHPAVGVHRRTGRQQTVGKHPPRSVSIPLAAQIPAYDRLPRRSHSSLPFKIPRRCRVSESFRHAASIAWPELGSSEQKDCSLLSTHPGLAHSHCRHSRTSLLLSASEPFLRFSPQARPPPPHRNNPPRRRRASGRVDRQDIC